MDEKVNAKVDSFFSKFKATKFKKGHIIIDPSKNPQNAYFIKNGFVKTYVISPDGIETTIHIFSTNSYFPMMSIIGDIPNRFYYVALTDVEIYQTPKQQLLYFLKKNSDVLFNLTHRLLSGLDKLTLRIEQLTSSKASVRLISVLLFLAKHFGEEKSGKIRIKHFFTHKDIASLAGLSRETTSREWKKLTDKKLVSSKSRIIVINNLDSLLQEI